MPQSRRRLSALLSTALVLACGSSTADSGAKRSGAAGENRTRPEATPEPLPKLKAAAIAPAVGSRTPNLVTTSSGLLLTWLEAGPGEEMVLRLARGTTEGWTEPLVITRGPLLDNWADFPAAAALPDGTLVATWRRRFEGDHGYGIEWSRSTDEGRSWSTPQILHEHTDGPEYGFVSTATTADNRLAVFWLDGRTSTADGGQMQLRTASIGRQGPPTDRQLVDDRVCDCCQTSAAATGRGPVVAYRDRSAHEIRDIFVAGPGLRQGEVVANDGWMIEGCPVNGPSLAAQGERLAIAWYTAANDEPRVWAAFGTVSGAFETPRAIDLGQPEGRVSLVMLDAYDAVVTWLERRDGENGAPGEAVILARRITRRGLAGPAYAVAKTKAARASGFPRSARLGDQLVWAWTEIGPGTSQVRVAQAPVSALG